MDLKNKEKKAKKLNLLHKSKEKLETFSYKKAKVDKGPKCYTNQLHNREDTIVISDKLLNIFGYKDKELEQDEKEYLKIKKEDIKINKIEVKVKEKKEEEEIKPKGETFQKQIEVLNSYKSYLFRKKEN